MRERARNGKCEHWSVCVVLGVTQYGWITESVEGEQMTVQEGQTLSFHSAE